MRKLRKVTLTAVVVGLVAAAAPAGAQVAWDSPFMVPPAAPRGLGVYLMEGSPGDGLGVMGTYRAADAPAGLGFRAGLSEDGSDDLSIFGGVDFSGYLARESADFPVDLVWNAGVGAGFGDFVLLSFPVGMTFGKIVTSDDVRFNPYVGPRLVLDALLGRDAPGGDDLDLGLAVDLGVDLSFDPRWAIRFGATIGDRDALAVGVVFPGAIGR